MLKRIAVIGPESTGKSDLARQLALEYKTEWVPEYARFHLDRMIRPYEKPDLIDIARGQLQWEDDKAELADKFLFCDTNLLVIKVWSDFKYGETDPWIEQEMRKRHYDFHLLANIDLPWMDDPQREHPDRREEIFNIYQDLLIRLRLPYEIISGVEDDRLANAVKALQSNGILH